MHIDVTGARAKSNSITNVLPAAPSTWRNASAVLIAALAALAPVSGCGSDSSSSQSQAVGSVELALMRPDGVEVALGIASQQLGFRFRALHNQKQ